MTKTRIIGGMRAFKLLALLGALLGCSGTSFNPGRVNDGGAAGAFAEHQCAGCQMDPSAGAAGAATRNVAARAGRPEAGAADGEGGESEPAIAGAAGAGSSTGGAGPDAMAAVNADGGASAACWTTAGIYRVGHCSQEPGALAGGCTRETHCIWDGSDTVCGCEACSWTEGYQACPLSEPKTGQTCDAAANAVLCVYVQRRTTCECVAEAWACRAIPCPSEAA